MLKCKLPPPPQFRWRKEGTWIWINQQMRIWKDFKFHILFCNRILHFFLGLICTKIKKNTENSENPQSPDLSSLQIVTPSGPPATRQRVKKSTISCLVADQGSPRSRTQYSLTSPLKQIFFLYSMEQCCEVGPFSVSSGFGLWFRVLV